MQSRCHIFLLFPLFRPLDGELFSASGFNPWHSLEAPLFTSQERSPVI